MNRIVREHYPVEKLPEDLRDGRRPGARVTVIVQDEAASDEADSQRIQQLLQNPRPMSLAEARALVGTRTTTPEEAVLRIRALRDEWDD